MTGQYTYPIGISGTPWNDEHKAQWLDAQQVKRAYSVEVLVHLQNLPDEIEVCQYGALPYEPSRYPLYALKSKHWVADKPAILVTGGVHGYETSGVQGALRFAQSTWANFSEQFNFVVVPCVSPWGYETINRWNPLAIDPNRSFYADSPAHESKALLAYIASLGIEFLAHFDLHETTDTDNSEFRPALAARDATNHAIWDIPDGFYLVGDTPNPQPEFQQAIVNEVAKVTHIAPADGQGKIIGCDLVSEGVILYDKKKLGLCGGLTHAPYVTTTEVYPDSPQADDENCIQAQVAAIRGGLQYLIASR